MNCPNCGANVPEGAAHCPACGQSLESERREQDTVIDVSGDRPELVQDEDEAASGGFVETRVGHARVYVARGNQRACLIPLAIVVLVLCCACLGFWGAVDSIF